MSKGYGIGNFFRIMSKDGFYEAFRADLHETMKRYPKLSEKLDAAALWYIAGRKAAGQEIADVCMQNEPPTFDAKEYLLTEGLGNIAHLSTQNMDTEWAAVRKVLGLEGTGMFSMYKEDREFVMRIYNAGNEFRTSWNRRSQELMKIAETPAVSDSSGRTNLAEEVQDSMGKKPYTIH